VSTPQVLCQPVRKRKAEGDFTPGELKNEVENSELASLLEGFIRQWMEGQGNIRVQKIFKFKTRYLLKTTSRCVLIKRVTWGP
jgi:hypothetical protein